MIIDFALECPDIATALIPVASGVMVMCLKATIHRNGMHSSQHMNGAILHTRQNTRSRFRWMVPIADQIKYLRAYATVYAR